MPMQFGSPRVSYPAQFISYQGYMISLLVSIQLVGLIDAR